MCLCPPFTLTSFCAGTSVPQKPINVVHTTLSSELAEVQFLIPAIAYTPENYSVVFGTDQLLLNYNTSDVVMGTMNVADTNMIYSIRLRGLEANTSYYYQVVARNSIGMNYSDTQVLTTPLPSK